MGDFPGLYKKYNSVGPHRLVPTDLELRTHLVQLGKG